MEKLLLSIVLSLIILLETNKYTNFIIQPTVGVDFVSKTVNIDEKVLRMQLWDTAGQERFHSLIPSYIKDSTAAIIVFDLTNPNSFNNLNKWI